MNNNVNNTDDLILALGSLIKENDLDEFEELKESTDNIKAELNKITVNNKDSNQPNK